MLGMGGLLQNGSECLQGLEALVAARNQSEFLYGNAMPIMHPLYQTFPYGGDAVDVDQDDCVQHPEKKRRLTADQIQLLEKSFECENKLEPERKVELAKELGMQPRQVAIWFQNRRARWKTKHLEKEYDDLKSSYDLMKIDYENLLKERDELKEKVLSLTEILLEKGNSKGILESLQLSIFPTTDSEPEDKPDTKIPISNEDFSSYLLASEKPRQENVATYSVVMETASSSDDPKAGNSKVSNNGATDELKMRGFVGDDSVLLHYDCEEGDRDLWRWPLM